MTYESNIGRDEARPPGATRFIGRVDSPLVETGYKLIVDTYPFYTIRTHILYDNGEKRTSISFRTTLDSKPTGNLTISKSTQPSKDGRLEVKLLTDLRQSRIEASIIYKNGVAIKCELRTETDSLNDKPDEEINWKDAVVFMTDYLRRLDPDELHMIRDLNQERYELINQNPEAAPLVKEAQEFIAENQFIERVLQQIAPEDRKETADLLENIAFKEGVIAILVYDANDQKGSAKEFTQDKKLDVLFSALIRSVIYDIDQEIRNTSTIELTQFEPLLFCYRRLSSRTGFSSAYDTKIAEDIDMFYGNAIVDRQGNTFTVNRSGNSVLINCTLDKEKLILLFPVSIPSEDVKAINKAMDNLGEDFRGVKTLIPVGLGKEVQSSF